MTTKSNATTVLRILPVPDHLTEDAARLDIAGFKLDDGYQVVFPNGASEEAVQHGAARMRNEAATQGTESNPNIWHMMVVEESQPDVIICFGLWFLVRTPRPGLTDPLDTYTPPADSNLEAFELLVHEGTRQRKELMRSQGAGDYLMLASLTTDAAYRKMGAATLMLTWGKELATQLRLPCFLQASEGGAPLYKKLGWKSKGTLTRDLSKWRPGLTEHTHSLMIWWPAGTEPGEA